MDNRVNIGDQRIAFFNPGYRKEELDLTTILNESGNRCGKRCDDVDVLFQESISKRALGRKTGKGDIVSSWFEQFVLSIGHIAP